MVYTKIIQRLVKSIESREVMLTYKFPHILTRYMDNSEFTI